MKKRKAGKNVRLPLTPLKLWDGNDLTSEALYNCKVCGYGYLCDVCHRHDEIRGACDTCYMLSVAKMKRTCRARERVRTLADVAEQQVLNLQRLCELHGKRKRE